VNDARVKQSINPKVNGQMSHGPVDDGKLRAPCPYGNMEIICRPVSRAYHK